MAGGIGRRHLALERDELFLTVIVHVKLVAFAPTQSLQRSFEPQVM
jgi:hypothetical protein